MRPLFLLFVLCGLASTAAADEPETVPATTMATTARAPVPALTLTGEAPVQASLRDPLRKSHFWAATHVIGVNAGFSVIGLAIGKDYLKISPSSIWTNLRSDWVWDEDAFDTNQFGHPYLGGLMFNAARSNGLGFWSSAAYSFVGSAFWELVMETETPSINDQIFTPTAGILLGEALHRFARAIRYDRGHGTSTWREILAAAVDPMGFISRVAHGDAWTLTRPPPRFGYIAMGWNGVSFDLQAPAGERLESSFNRVHLALGSSYGLPSDPSFEPRRPLDHYDFLIEGHLSTDSVSYSLATRGLIWGRGFDLGCVRALGGLMAAYDFTNPERIRVGAFGLGAGVVFHAPLRDVAFLQGTLMATAIPFGAAGSDLDVGPSDRITDRDYHRGPGSGQLLELKLGRPGLGLIHFTSRSFVIDGEYFDEGTELVELARLGVLASVYGHHSIGVEGSIGYRRGTFRDSDRDVEDSTALLRISYVYAADLGFGGGP